MLRTLPSLTLMLAQGAVMTVTGTIVSPATNAPTPLPPDGSSQPCSQPTNTPLMIGGVALMVTQVDCQGTWTTTAWSTAPEIYVQGQAHTPKLAALQLSVIQTIRFSH
jgi:hypothetical protein